MKKKAKKHTKAKPSRKEVAKPLSGTQIVRMIDRLNLADTVPSWAERWAIEAFAKGDAEGFTSSAYSTGGTLAIVVDNGNLLMKRGIYEAALVHGYTGCKWSHRLWDMDVIQSLFDLGDREKLRAVGAPLPGPGPFTVYRGVSREGKERQVDGMSWTTSLDVACFFALVWKHDPAVYQATVSADEVYLLLPRTRRRRVHLPAYRVATLALESGGDRKRCRPLE